MLLGDLSLFDFSLSFTFGFDRFGAMAPTPSSEWPSAVGGVLPPHSSDVGYLLNTTEGRVFTPGRVYFKKKTYGMFELFPREGQGGAVHEQIRPSGGSLTEGDERHVRL